MPKITIVYKHIVFPVYLTLICGCGPILFGALHVYIMRPYSALSYIMIGGAAGGITLYCAPPILAQDFKVMDNYSPMCQS